MLAFSNKKHTHTQSGQKTNTNKCGNWSDSFLPKNANKNTQLTNGCTTKNANINDNTKFQKVAFQTFSSCFSYKQITN